MPKKLRPLEQGEQFGKLTVIHKLEGHTETTYLCKCACGDTKPIKASFMLRGKIVSCGKPGCKPTATTHGLTDTPLYKVWQSMRFRTKHATGANKCYEDISVCHEWDNFKHFHAWAISSGYSIGLTIDRIDNSADYSPDNCRWVDKIVQAQNRKGWANAEVKYKGVCKSKPRNKEVKYPNTGQTPYYWRYSYKGSTFQGWGFTSAEEAYKDKCRHIKEHHDGLVYP